MTSVITSAIVRPSIAFAREALRLYSQPVRMLVNAISDFGKHDKWAQIRQRSYVFHCMATRRYVGDREIQLELAKGAVNAIADFGEHEKWAEMTQAWDVLQETARRHADDREIQVRLAQGAVNAINCLGKHEKWAEMTQAWDVLQETADTHADDPAIGQCLSLARWLLGHFRSHDHEGAGSDNITP